ncbi:MAG: hypothetical protein QF830_02730 [Rhodospirillales bacterium]|jgi:hypothetical protein|nr:hypothetical protein [Rhodospirillales bacterium]MDP6883028.1 hypothetical protein [Rhodospirillales bacterium]
MLRLATITAVLFVLAACSSYEKGEVVESNPREIKIGVALDAAVNGVDSRRQASEHCAESGKGAVWYGHDRDGTMHYRCE